MGKEAGGEHGNWERPSSGPWGAAAPQLLLTDASWQGGPTVARAPDSLKEARNLDFYMKSPNPSVLVTNFGNLEMWALEGRHVELTMWDPGFVPRRHLPGRPADRSPAQYECNNSSTSVPSYSMGTLCKAPTSSQELTIQCV